MQINRKISSVKHANLLRTTILMLSISAFVLYFSDIRAEANCDSTIIFDVGDTSTYKNRLRLLLECKELKDLTIRIMANKGWVVFPAIQGVDQGFRYSTKIKLGFLPEEICNAKELESLDVSDLGLSKLPQNLSNLSSLELLDISFNRIEIADELTKIFSLENLKVLKIYGCNFTEAVLTEIKTQRPNLRILFSQEHLIEDAKSKRKDNKN